MKLKFTSNTSTVDEIAEHLKAVGPHFIPPLNTYVEDIDAYAEKLHKNSFIAEAWVGTVLVGISATYINDPNKETAFLTNTSVLNEYHRLGIGKKLSMMIMNKCVEECFSSIDTEINKENFNSLILYETIGFKIKMDLGNSFILTKNIKDVKGI